MIKKEPNPWDSRYQYTVNLNGPRRRKDRKHFNCRRRSHQSLMKSEIALYKAKSMVKKFML